MSARYGYDMNSLAVLHKAKGAIGGYMPERSHAGAQA